MEFAINNLSFAYKHSMPLFQNISFTLHEGDLLTILGPNGAGKTTLLLCLMNLLTYYEGSVCINGVDVRTMSAKEKARHIAYAMSNEAKSVDLAVEDYLCLGVASSLAYYRSPSKAQYDLAKWLCKEYSMEKLSGRKVSSLSQGERQIITILRVLMQGSQIILLDEPTSSLDIKNQRQVLQLIHNLSVQKKTIIQVSHDPNHAQILGGKCLLMGAHGRASYGNVLETVSAESLSELYQTEIQILKDPGISRYSITFRLDE